VSHGVAGHAIHLAHWLVVLVILTAADQTVAASIDPIHEFHVLLNQTGLMRWADTAHSYLAAFLWTAVPFVVAHGIFLALILGVFWKDKFGAVDYDDLRVGTKLMLMAMSVSFAVDMFQLGARSFAWIRARTDAVMTRSLVIHMVIIFGMALTVFTNNDPARFFNVFLVLKFLADLSSELPQWNPKKPPEALTRMAESVKKKTSGGKKGKRKDDEDFATYWARTQAEQQAGFAEDEEVMTPAQLKRFG